MFQLIKKYPFYSICFLVLSGICITSIWAINYFGFGLKSSLLPEIFGFSLEGIFFVLLFSKYENYKAKSLDIENKKKTKQHLLLHLRLLKFWATHPEYDEKYDIEKMSPKDIVSQLWETGEIEACARDFVQKIAMQTKPILLSYNSVVSSINNDHLNVWIILTNSVISLSEEKSDEEFYKWIERFLTYLDKFESLELE